MTDHDIIELIEPVIRTLKIYHRYSVSGLEHIPKKGRGIIVVNHSLATYDICMLIHSIYIRTGRMPRPLVDRLFEKLPLINTLFTRLGCVPGRQCHAQNLLLEDQLILVAPGGMAEAIRPYTERYQIKWQDKRGFIRLAITSQTPIILAFCPSSDDLYKVYDTQITRWCYRNLRLPMMFVRGLGPTLFPRPVKLKHYISPPIMPPQVTHNDPEQVIDLFHEKVMEQAKSMMLSLPVNPNNPRGLKHY
ncbi:MAG: lysophospholipid acyltransferase family protein [Proteobacteria bacterium]|nr:lysophospholipid acyltransferase family protein [Pseudomonadota bacterium]